jgi:DNA-directed RNA polymerase subunit RPC12/RpoP
MKNEWINDATYKCKTCEHIFKVYGLDDEPVVNFCPSCASRELEDYDEEED